MPWTPPKRTNTKRPQGWANPKETFVYHFSQNISGIWEVLPGGVIRAAKTAYLDDTHAGFWLGIDTDGLAKLNLGSNTHYLKWTGTGIAIKGELSAGNDAVRVDDDGIDIIATTSTSTRTPCGGSPLHGEPFTHRIYALLTVGRSDLYSTVEAAGDKDSYWNAVARASAATKPCAACRPSTASPTAPRISLRRSAADGSQVQITGYGGAKVQLYGTLCVSDVDDDELATEGTAAVRKGFYAGSTTNYTKIDSAGHQTMVGNGRPWRNELGSLLEQKRKGARVAEDLDEGTVLFPDSCVVADDWIILNLELNHDKDLTAAISPHLHWFQASSNVPNWLLQYRWQVQGAAKTTAWTSAKYTAHATTYVSGTLNQITKWTAIAVPSGTALGDIVQIRLLRDTANDVDLVHRRRPVDRQRVSPHA